MSEEHILNEKRRYRDPHFDAIPIPTARIEDLDLRRFEEEYLPLAVDPATLAENERTIEQRLAAMKMIGSDDSPTPTIAGILVLGKSPREFLPGAYVQFLRIAGNDLSDPVTDEARCDGPLLNLVNRLDDKLIAHNRTAVDFTSGDREIRTPTYPLPALQQLARNAALCTCTGSMTESRSPVLNGRTVPCPPPISGVLDSSTTATRSWRSRCVCWSWYSAMAPAYQARDSIRVKTDNLSRNSKSNRTGFSAPFGYDHERNSSSDLLQ